MTETIVTFTVTMRSPVPGTAMILADNISDEISAKLDRFDIPHEIEHVVQMREVTQP